MTEPLKRVRRTKAELLESDVSALKLEVQRRALKKRLEVMDKFDVLQASSQKKRRQPVIERDSEDTLMRTYDRQRAINITRDLERNFSSAKSIIHQVKVNVVGPGPKLRCHTDSPDDNVVVENYFNSVYAKDCDYRDSANLGDMLQLMLANALREGDVLCVFDDGIIDNTGKLVIFEADQLVDIEDKDNIPAPYKTMTCQNGVIFDKWGKVQAYVVTSKRGISTAKYADVTIIPVATCRLLKRTWRPNQLRGTPDMLTCAADLQDLYEMRSKELQSAKLQASFAGVVKKRDVTKDFKLLNDAADTCNVETSAATQYERLEALTGGILEYLEPTDDFDFLDFNRPNVNFSEANDFILRSAGAALGLSKTYTTLNTEASYTAFRGDLLLSWASFYALQKWLERQLCDWLANKAITRAISAGIIEVSVTDVIGKISWVWPTMPVVDQLKEAMANSANIGSLLQDYSETLGPDWKAKFDALAEQVKYATDKGLPIKVFSAITAPEVVAQQLNGSGGDKEE